MNCNGQLILSHIADFCNETYKHQNKLQTDKK